MSISIVIPAFNVADTIHNCLESIFGQSESVDEIIVINDSSTDGTLEILKSYKDRIKLYSLERNSGAAFARNFGIKMAKSDWVAFLDADDEWMEDKVAKLKKAIIDNPSSVFIATDEFEGPSGGPWVYKPLHQKFDKDKNLFFQLYRRCFLSTSTITVKREILLKVGGMDESLRSAQDYDLWLKIALIGNLAFIPEPLSKYILRKGTISSNPEKRYHCMMRIIDKYRNEVSINLYYFRILIVHWEVISMYSQSRSYMMIIRILLRLPFILLSRLLKLSYPSFKKA